VLKYTTAHKETLTKQLSDLRIRNLNNLLLPIRQCMEVWLGLSKLCLRKTCSLIIMLLLEQELSVQELEKVIMLHLRTILWDMLLEDQRWLLKVLLIWKVVYPFVLMTKINRLNVTTTSSKTTSQLAVYMLV